MKNLWIMGENKMKQVIEMNRSQLRKEAHCVDILGVITDFQGNEIKIINEDIIEFSSIGLTEEQITSIKNKIFEYRVKNDEE